MISALSNTLEGVVRGHRADHERRDLVVQTLRSIEDFRVKARDDVPDRRPGEPIDVGKGPQQGQPLSRERLGQIMAGLFQLVRPDLVGDDANHGHPRFLEQAPVDGHLVDRLADAAACHDDGSGIEHQRHTGDAQVARSLDDDQIVAVRGDGV
jgi:hypothetical protein